MAKLPVIDVGRITCENPTEENWVSISKEIGEACLNYGKCTFPLFDASLT
jgi:hypothetical protein